MGKAQNKEEKPMAKVTKDMTIGELLQVDNNIAGILMSRRIYQYDLE